ncbi:Transcriptional adapter ada2 [Ascosphaera acerosa]|nr:Transcriptional adapter ada2 [Ascosphaera acerosa]
MGVIRKKTVSRGTEACPAQVRINCASPACQDYDLCVPCFADGASSKQHDPRTHPFYVIEQNSVPIFTPDWGADEELLLLESIEIYGLGSWADIADHIGGFRAKDEVRDHYIDTYINSPLFPLPERADPADTRLQDEISKEEFQAKKKRRIEERREAARLAAQQKASASAGNPALLKQKPTASVPACHEVQGYMPGRLEFEHEYLNEAEEGVQSMSFEPAAVAAMERERAAGQPLDAEMELKMTIKDIYISRLDERVKRKKLILEHNLLDYRKNQALEKKKTKEEKELLNKVKPFAQMMNHADFTDFARGLEYEHNLRLAIAQLQDWRVNGIADLRSGETYERQGLAVDLDETLALL